MSRAGAAAALAVAAGIGAGLTAVATADAASTPQIRVLSSRADLVSGGQALLAVDLPKGVLRRQIRVRVAGRDVTVAFTRRGTGPLVGTVSGLRTGRTAVTVRRRSGRGARLVLTNHPSGGPLFAGAQVQPWRCLTAPAGLGPALNDRCDAARPVRRLYYKQRSTGRLVAHRGSGPIPPADIATTTTDDGRTVPYVVEVERGTLDRSVYDIATLHDPASGRTTWNGKLFVPFGGSCSTKHSQAPPGVIEVSQSAPDGAVVLDRQLSRGYAVATTGLSTLGQNCNPVVSAEALAMLKERVVEQQGRAIRFTLSEGCSGGSVQQHQIADAYPGLLDGIIPSCSFPDLWSVVTELAECGLIEHYLTSTSPVSALARQPVEGSQLGTTCPAFVVAFGAVLRPADRSSPTVACDVPADRQYDPARNRGGVRCAIQDYQRAVWGPDPATGFARRPLDNVGVQYGLAAVQDGRITPEQFVDLNARIGGLDADGNPSPQRMRADDETVRIAYRSDQIVRGRGLAAVPILDLRGTGNAEIHTDHWSYATRARLRAANGTAANQLIWTDVTSGFATIGQQLPIGPGAAAFDLMDRWVTAIKADGSRRTPAQKVLANRPPDARDACFTPQRVDDPATCARLFPHFGNPRTVAGAPQALDVVRCTRRPLDRTAYRVAFTDAQWARLHGAFPDGVCDWAASAAAPRPAPLTWATYAGGPGGRALGPAPRSTRLGAYRRR